MTEIQKRLEEIRAAIDAESISYGEIAELQDLAEHIAPGDVQLLEWAGDEWVASAGQFIVADECDDCDCFLCARGEHCWRPNCQNEEAGAGGGSV